MTERMTPTLIIPRIFAAMMLAASLFFAPGIRADDTMPGMDHGDHKVPAGKTKNTPSTVEYKAASDAMHRAMAAPLTGDADVDFVRGMIAHHQGAIDMAKVELRYGKDKMLRELAEGIIRTQEAEIAQMAEWLKRRGY